MATKDVIASYGAAWNEADEASRTKLLEEAWSDDGVYTDPLGRAEGRAALVAHITGFQETMAGHELRLTTEPDEHDGFVRFAWSLLGPDGGSVMDGVDFGTLADDGRIRQIVGFFGPMTPAAS